MDGVGSGKSSVEWRTESKWNCASSCGSRSRCGCGGRANARAKKFCAAGFDSCGACGSGEERLRKKALEGLFNMLFGVLGCGSPALETGSVTIESFGLRAYGYGVEGKSASDTGREYACSSGRVTADGKRECECE